MTSPTHSNPRHTPHTWLEPHCAAFLSELTRLGYSLDTWRQYERTVESFRTALSQHDEVRPHLDGAMLDRLRAKVLNATPQSGAAYGAYRLDQLVASLVKAGVATLLPPPAKPQTPREALLAEYESYLRVQRGLSEPTIYQCRCLYERFMTDRFGDGLGNLMDLVPGDVVAFCHKIKSRTAWPSHLRNLFQFLFWSGKTKVNLAASLPRVSRSGTSNLPRYASADSVQKIVDAAHSDDALGRRDYAIVLLMARLGLRAPEVVAIQLDDLDWRSGELLVRGKGKLHDRLPLPSEVGEAIVSYIQNGRLGDSRALFVTHRAPHRPFKDGQIIKEVLSRALAKAGLPPMQKHLGSHLLRHSLATTMLGNGASLEEIRHVMRHRSRLTTTIYAKCDVATLRSIAQSWPTEGDAL